MLDFYSSDFALFYCYLFKIGIYEKKQSQVALVGVFVFFCFSHMG